MKHKKQHYVPRSYLEAWCDAATPQDRDPYVWVFPKDGGAGRRRAPKNIFHETDMYTIQRADGARDLALEHGLAGLEADFAMLRRDKLANRADLGLRDRLIVCAFIAAAQARTRKQGNHFRSLWSGLLEAMCRTLPHQRKDVRTSSFEALSSEPSLGYDEVKRLAEAPLQHMLHSVVSTQLPILYGMDLAILSTDDDLGFITSDAPCVWFDPEAHRRPYLYRAPGLAWPTIEVTLPASPGQLLLINRAGLNGYYRIPARVVDELNRRTRAHADEHFVVQRNEAKPAWYKMGAPPPAAQRPRS